MRSKTAILTGASYGIGPYIARGLAREGFNIALAARSVEGLDRVTKDLVRSGVKGISIPTDLSDAHSRDRLQARAQAELGPIDVLINNAGVHYAGRLHMRTQAEIDRIIQTNVTAPIALSRALLPGMLERRSGHIVQVASIAGKVGLPYLSVYSATKYALVGFTHSLQGELRGTGVRSSVVCPGFVRNDGMWARLNRTVHVAFGLSAPERVAAAVINALKPGSVETLVNPLPVRPVVAMWALTPRIAAAVFQLLGVSSSSCRNTGLNAARPSAHRKSSLHVHAIAERLPHHGGTLCGRLKFFEEMRLRAFLRAQTHMAVHRQESHRYVQIDRHRAS